jgi:hypothetical protein
MEGRVAQEREVSHGKRKEGEKAGRKKPFVGCRTAQKARGRVSAAGKPCSGSQRLDCSSSNDDRSEKTPLKRTIIFSTIALVSPSKSPNFEFSGWILVVLILGAEVTT